MNTQDMQMMPVVNTADLSTWNTLDEILPHAWLVQRRKGALLTHSFNGKRDDAAFLAAIESIGAKVVFESTTCSGCLTIVVESESFMATVSQYGANVFADSMAIAKEFVNAVAASFIPSAPVEERVDVQFVCSSKMGTQRRVRQIESPTWAEIEANYSTIAREQLSQLMAAVKPTGGRLVVLSGAPGTGKTTATRALIREWRPWARAIYVMDPELFFDNPAYMNDLIAGAEEDDDEPVTEADRKKWLVFIVEDADEYLVAESKSRHGRSVARVLNLLDGMIGQGLNLLMIMTANLDGANVNEAFARPGRCLMEVDFDRLTLDDAQRWASRNGLDPDRLTERGTRSIGLRNRSDFSLAELYRLLQ